MHTRKSRSGVIAFIAFFAVMAQLVTGFCLAALADPAAAPELDGGVGYLNTTHPVTLKGLRGHFVLLDFWTFCCINCMHILPHLAELEQKYGDRLTVVGIHSAKFENEKDSENITRAIARYSISHPVINDAEFKIWDAYNVQAWPTLVLIDPEGKLLATYSGEGHTDEIAAEIERTSPLYQKRGSLKLTVEKKPGPPQVSSELAFPGKISLSPDKKYLAIADTGHNRILIASLSKDGTRAVIEFQFGKNQGLKDGQFKDAAFNGPQGLAVVGTEVFVADTGNNAIRKIDLNTATTSTVCGDGNQAHSGAKGGSISGTQLSSPWDIIPAGTDRYYVAMAGSHQIWHLNLKNKTIKPLIGSGREDILDGNYTKAALAQTSGLTSDGATIYFADAETSSIRSTMPLSKAVPTVSTLIGKGLFIFGDVDGPLEKARLQHPLGVAWAPGAAGTPGLLYIADSYNHKIKCLDLKAKTIKTIAGNGKSGYKDGTEAQFAEPGGLAYANGKIYVADTNNSVIRVITLPTKAGAKASTDTLQLIWPR
ncbi:MAG: redoxin domain-containing protein [Cyanobacteria bacterium SZAS LIN-2]|nr:redoxin domain-containing protein [Cyanobacteria bacterium SZAS LIN-2]